MNSQPTRLIDLINLNQFPESHQILIKLFSNNFKIAFETLWDDSRTIVSVDDSITELVDGDVFVQSKSAKAPLSTIIHPQMKAQVLNGLNEAINAKEIFFMVYQVIGKLGKPLWVFEQSQAKLDANGNVIGVIGCLIEVTQQKSFIEHLLREKDFYKETLNAMPVELVIYDRDHKFLFCNESAVNDPEIRKWLIGKNELEYFSLKGRKKEVAKNRIDYFAKSINEKKEIEWEETIRKKDGSLEYTQKRFSPILNNNGEVELIIGYGWNITDRRLAQNRLDEQEKILQALNLHLVAGIYRSSEEKGLIYVNAPFVKMFGYESQSELLSTPSKDLYFNYEERLELMANSDSESALKNEVLFKRKDGSTFWGLVSGIKSVDSSGKTVFNGAIIDITRRKEGEELLKHKNEELKKANQELDRFVYSASHDLRSPLTSMLGLITIARAESKDPVSLEYFQMIEDNVKSLDSYIIDIISHSRNSRMELKKEEINFKSIINEVAKNLRFISGADLIDLNVQVEEKARVYSDPSRLKIIFNNLITNSVRYHKDGDQNKFINISVNTIPEENQCFIGVEDNGKGIDGKHLGRIFEMFYRGTTQSSGSGLGLYIVKEALDKLEGDLSVDSEVGRGTIFYITIPMS